ncbi:MAG: Sulfatase [archaeon ADurb.Bin336]|nr:MAG: Sulfatase [archaeon ADurb.Bin336]
MNNIVLISLDCVRADVGYSKKFSALNELMKNGVSFMNTISSAPLTPVSHASVLTGLQPYNHGVRHLFKEKMNKDVITIQQLLKKKGYRTAAIVSCPGMHRWYGFNKGFDYYDDEIPRLADGSDPLKTVDVKLRGTALKRANVVYERGLKWLEKNKESPFFLFLHFFDAHWPYEAPKVYGGDNVYEEEVAFSNHYLKMFFDKLKEFDLWDNTTIICFSDHGEDLGGLYPNDKSGKKLGHPEEFGHGCLLYDQTQKVLFIIKNVNLPKNKRVLTQVRLIDIFPTIIELESIKFNSKIDGKSVIKIINGLDKEDRQGYSETFYPEEQGAKHKNLKFVKNKKSLRINNKFKVIVNLDSNLIELYDLQTDPNEKINLNK